MDPQSFTQIVREELKRRADGGATFVELSQCLVQIHERMGSMERAEEIDYGGFLRYCRELKPPTS